MRKLFFILLICNMLFVNAQSLELENWKIINSSELNAGSAEVSQLAYPTAGWYQATVPTTVLNALVKENVYPDPRIGLNNYLIPDVSDEFNFPLFGVDKARWLAASARDVRWCGRCCRPLSRVCAACLPDSPGKGCCASYRLRHLLHYRQ